MGGFAAALVCGVILTAIFADYVAPYDPMVGNPNDVFLPPSRKHLFGTDNVGRDVLSRVIFGARISLVVGVASVALGTACGAAIGLLSGFVGGRFDMFVQRVIDVLMSVPGLVLLLLIVAVFGTGMRNVIFAIAFFLATGPSRIVRGAVLVERDREYVIAARMVGASGLRIMVRHVLPNVVPVVIVAASVGVSTAILTEASLSFLGLGVPPPSVSWGRMIGGDARTFFLVAPWLALFPGAALSMTVFGFNILGDTVRDLVDPRMRR
jgi:peptide/nickel transport system permease protein